MEMVSACADVLCTYQSVLLWNAPVEQHLLGCLELHAAQPPLDKKLNHDLLFCRSLDC